MKQSGLDHLRIIAIAGNFVVRDKRYHAISFPVIFSTGCSPDINLALLFGMFLRRLNAVFSHSAPVFIFILDHLFKAELL